MENEFVDKSFTITDENGVDIELEHLDVYEEDGEVYMAFLPKGSDLAVAYELIVLKVEYDDVAEEDILVTIEDEEEDERIFHIFEERLEGTFFDDDEDEEYDEDDEDEEIDGIIEGK